MEEIALSILGNYRPFTDNHLSPSTTSAPKPLQRPKKRKGPQPFQFGAAKVEGTKVENVLGSAFLPCYELFPPTIDDYVTDESILHGPTKSPALAQGYDVELTIQDSKVTWSQANVLRKVFTMEAENETVRQALFAWFLVSDTRRSKREETRMERGVDNAGSVDDRTRRQERANARRGTVPEGRMQALVIVLEKIIRIYYPNGEENVVHIPFVAEKVWAMELGILIEAKISEKDVMGLGRTSFQEPNRIAFHMLVDPYEMPESVLVLRVPGHGDPSIPGVDGLQERLDVENDNTCVFVTSTGDDERVLVTYDRKLRTHRFWTYRTKHSPPKAVESDDSSMEIDSTGIHGSSISEMSCEVLTAWSLSHVFTAHTLDGSTVVCILDKTALSLVAYVVSSDASRANLLWTRPAVSAVGVIATRRHQKDILLLCPDGTFALWTGYERKFLPCRLPIDYRKVTLLPSPTLPHPKSKQPADAEGEVRVIELRDPVEDRASAVLSSGHVIRFRLDFQVRASVVQESLDALAFALPLDLLWEFRHRFFSLQFGHDFRMRSIKADEWSNFATTLLSFCNPKLQSKEDNISAQEDLSDWEFFLNSPLQKKTSKLSHARGLAADLPSTASRLFWTMVEKARQLSEFSQTSSVKDAGRVETYYSYILVALHLVNEDRSLNVVSSKEADMVPLLMILSRIVHWDSWADYYARRNFSISTTLTDLPEVLIEGHVEPLDIGFDDPPSILDWIVTTVSRSGNTWVYPTLSSLPPLRDDGQSNFPVSARPCEQTRKIVLLFNTLMSDNLDTAVQTMFDEGYTVTLLNQLQSGISIILKEALWKARQKSSSTLNASALSFIGRFDLAELQTNYNSGRVAPPTTSGSSDTPKLDPVMPEEPNTKNGTEEKLEPTGADVDASEITQLRFGEDRRIHDTQEMLQSARARTVRLEDDPNLDEIAQREAQQETLGKMAQRTLALPLGRAALTFGVDSRPIVSQKLLIPSVNLDVKITPGTGITKLEDPTLRNEDTLPWAYFHNAVAAALRISPESHDVTDSWIRFQYPGRRQVEEDKDYESATHGGVLLGLGITRHLRSLGHTLPSEYLTTKKELYNLGLLLGLSCAFRGTMNDRVIKLLTAHMPSWLHELGNQFDLSLMTQDACFVGMGLLHSETCSAKMMLVMAQEIGLDPRTGLAEARAYRRQESHSLSAGFGLGWTTLGLGDKKSVQLASIVRILHDYLPTIGVSSNVSEPAPGRHRAESGATAVGAAIALGLMYIRTNNKIAARKLDPPDSKSHLDYVTPASLQLRVICRSIIMWDSILPSETWVLSQIPDFLKNDEGGPPDIESAPQAYYSMLAGACFAIGLRFAGSGLENVYSFLVGYIDRFAKLGPRGVTFEEKMTRATVKSCLDVITMATAMVVAGSGSVDLLRRLRTAHQRVKGDTGYGSHLAQHLSMGLLFLGGGAYTLGTSNHCVAALLCSLYPRLPSFPADNRTHLQAFRHLWVLAVEPRCLVTRDYKTRVACPVPIRVHLKPFYGASNAKALLEMTNALELKDRSRFTKGHDDETATHKDFMPSVMDVFTPCLLPELSTITKVEILGPRYFPMSLDVALESQEAFAKVWRMLRARSVSVIQRTAYLSYSEDSLGSRGILVKPFPAVLTTSGSETSLGHNPNQKTAKRKALDDAGVWKLMEGVTGIYRQQTMSAGKSIYTNSDLSDQTVGQAVLQDYEAAAFARNLCLFEGPGSQSVREYHDWQRRVDRSELKEDLKSAAFHTEALYECLIMDKTEALVDLMWLFNMENRLEQKGELTWQTLWDIKILKAHYDSLRERHDWQRKEQGRPNGRLSGGNTARKNVGSSSNFGGGSGGGGSSERFVQDDGSETFLKMQRISDLYNKITSRVDHHMGEENSWSLYERMDMDKMEAWRRAPGVQDASYYFAAGSFRPRQESKSSDKSLTPSPLWLPERLSAWESCSKDPNNLFASFPHSISDQSDSRQKMAVDLLKAWLEIHRVPGPSTIRAIIEDMDKHPGFWEALDAEEEVERSNEDRRLQQLSSDSLKDRHRGSSSSNSAPDPSIRSGAAHHKLTKMWKVAYPGVPLRLLRYLRPGHRWNGGGDEK